MDIIYLQKAFSKVPSSDHPDLHLLHTTQEISLWVLLIAKNANITKKMSADQISFIAREIFEITIKPRAITNALNRSGTKVHPHKEGTDTYYEIMKQGKDSLISKDSNAIDLLYFEPGTKFNSRKILSDKIFDILKGSLAIVDPYCGTRTLDILNAQKRDIRFLTRLDNIKIMADRMRLIREITDFKTENPLVEFKDYKNVDIHDRYILSDDSLVLLGHSMKDLGGKESFAIKISKSSNRNIYEAMVENFNRRWKASTII